MSKLVGIVLVNYKDYAKKFLADCWLSLQKQDYPSDLRKIYIVDNASSLESKEYLESNYSSAKILVRTDGNYAAANNLAFRQAIKDNCEYIVTVNMDTEMETTWLSSLVKALDNNPQAAIAQSKILLFSRNKEKEGSKKINSLGNIINFLGFGFTSAYGEADQNIKDYPEILGYASGCSFIIRSCVWQEIGGYDEEFYMYHDDLELSLKVKLAGYHIILAPCSVIYHKYEFSRSVNMIYYMERNRYLTMLLFYPKYLLLLISPIALVLDIAMLFYSFINSWLSSKLKVYLYFLSYSNWRNIIAKRRQLKKIKKINFNELASNFSGSIDFQEINNPLLKYIFNPISKLYWQLIKLFI